MPVTFKKKIDFLYGFEKSLRRRGFNLPLWPTGKFYKKINISFKIKCLKHFFKEELNNKINIGICKSYI